MTDYKAVAASLRACTDPQKRYAADVIDNLRERLLGDQRVQAQRDQFAQEAETLREALKELVDWKGMSCDCGVGDEAFVKARALLAANPPLAGSNG